MPCFIEAKLFILIISICSIIGDWKEARGSSFYLSVIYFKTKQSDKKWCVKQFAIFAF